MRIKPAVSFPHPVLSESTGDYGGRAFRIALAVHENPESGDAVLSGSMTLDDAAVRKLIDEGRATAGVMVTCLDTYMDDFLRCQLGDVHIDLSGGVVRGTVFVRGVVVASQDNLSLDSELIDPEFPNNARTISAGNFIAMTEELKFEAGLEKLVPLESVFHLRLNEDMEEGYFAVDLGGEAIEIFVGPGLHGFLGLLRGQKMKDVLLSSLFLPVVICVLDAMRGESAYEEKRWHSVISARCSAEQIDIKHGDLVESAQRLLDSPLGSLQRVFERYDA